MLLKATKFFFFLFVLYAIHTIVIFIMDLIVLPDTWEAFQNLLWNAPIAIAFLFIYLVLGDIIGSFYKAYADMKGLALKTETQNKKLEKELKELKEQLKEQLENNEN